MQELFRVLKKGGTLIAQVPLDESRESTFEDDSIVDYHERTKIFGQYDHVRVYGRDYYDRLTQVGFAMEAKDFLARLSTKEKTLYALPTDEKIPIGVKR